MAKVCPHGKVRTVGRGQRRTVQAKIMRMAGDLVTQHLIRQVIGIVFGLGTLASLPEARNAAALPVMELGAGLVVVAVAGQLVLRSLWAHLAATGCAR